MTADDEQEIRELVLRWADAVHTGDLDGVLVDHAADIVMFDVPPPEDGIRGHEAYRDTWPPFFEWQRAGAVFDIVELSVTSGADVAFRVGAAAMWIARRARRQPRPPTPAHDRAPQGRGPMERHPRAPFVHAPELTEASGP